MKKWPVFVAVIMLGGTWGALQSLSHGEPVLSKQPFAQFPPTIAGRWQGRELSLESRVLDVLKLSDYLVRVYTPIAPSSDSLPLGGRSEGEAASIGLYVGYYQSQRTGSTYHSPKNCLPGSGWQFVESEEVPLLVDGAVVGTMNKALIQKGLDKQLVLYWYHDRGRVVASEYWARGYLLWDAMTKNRTDGALVRLTVSVTTTPDSAYQHGLAFLHDLWPTLQEFMPSGESAT